MLTSCAVISPVARGAATAGGPEFGKRARRKSPRRSANRFLLKRALRKAEIPSLPRHLPYARALSVAQGMRLYMVEREGARDVTARCRSSFLRTGVQPNALSHSFQSALIGRATSPGA